MSDYDDLMKEEERGLSEREKYNLKVSRLSDQEFAKWASYQNAKGDALKRKEAAQPAPRPEPTEDEAKIAMMSEGELNDYLRSIGVNSNLSETLSDPVYRDKKRHVE